METLTTLGLAMGTAWTSGINLYATVAILGLLEKFGATKLPGDLHMLGENNVIAVAVFLYLIEFFADKIPYLDNVWDALHTFIRVPAGAVIAYGATNQMDPTILYIATLLGGGLALSSHGTKSGVRMGANVTPEPFSNWFLSITEDILAFVGVILAVFFPIVIIIFLVLFLIFFVWFAPKVWVRSKAVFQKAKGIFQKYR
ncbi:MAG: DUF4126 domain-containing protein [Leptospiraceae bacterium]|nr:DUF4126 domain-containing protein [Leptospiraceae bacterium]